MHLLTILLTIGLSSSDTLDFERPIHRGLEHIYHLNFDQADACFDSIVRQSPGHPAGYYFKATSFFYQIISGSNPNLSESTFMEWNDKTIDIAEDHPDEVTGLFYRGTAYGNIARYHVVNGDFIKAFFYARKAKALHEELLSRRPGLHDAELTLGVYNYYASALPQWMGLVAGLLGLGGDRDIGIAQLERAFQKGRISGIESHLLLANVYFEEGNYEKSIENYTQLISRYPDNCFLHNQMGVVLFSMEQFAGAEKEFREAHRLAGQRLPSAAMFAAYYLGRILKLKNEYPAAVASLDEAVQLSTRQRLFQSINAWIPPSAMYQSGECNELAGRRAEALKQYKAARENPLASKSIVEAAGNRARYELSAFEKELMRGRHLVLYGRHDDGLHLLLPLQQRASAEYKRFRPQIDYYIGRVAFFRGNFKDALNLFMNASDADDNEDWRRTEARYYLALCHLQLNQIDAARSALKEVLKTDNPRLKFNAKRRLSTL